MTGQLLRRDTEGHMKMEMETGVMLPQPRKPEPAGARIDQEGSSPGHCDNHVPAATLISRCLASRTVRR